jgi:LemA protein
MAFRFNRRARSTLRSGYRIYHDFMYFERRNLRSNVPMSTSTWIVLGAIALLVIWIIILYNGLVAMRQRVNQAFADVDVQLKQRHDLVPNLVETVKGYASHERGTLEAVVQARNAAMAAQGPAQMAQAENMLTGALRQLFALSEAYPDLKANQNFQQLQTELADLENKIAAARRFFNNAVQEYNTGIQQFPAVLIAGPTGFTQKEFFDLGSERTTVGQTPQVKF